jgi:hypothetical protein
MMVSSGRGQQGGVKEIFIVLLMYLGVTIVVTFPLIMHFTTRMPGGSLDNLVFPWNLWWMKHALVDLKTNPLYTDHVLHPHFVGLSFHAFIPLNGLLSIPLQSFVGLVTIHNMFIFLSFVLSGLGVYLLARHHVDDRRAAFVGGLIFAFCPFRMNRLQHMNVLMTHWMPLYILFLFLSFSRERGSRPAAVMSGVLLGMNFLTDYYAFIYMLFFTAVFLLFRVFFQREGVKGLFGRLALITASSLPLILPMLTFAVGDLLSGRVASGFSRGGVEENVADLAGLFSPHPANPFLGWLSFSDRLTGIENFSYIGLVASVLVVAGLVGQWRERRDLARYIFWLVAAGMFTLLSFGPSLHVLGVDTGLPMPQGIMTQMGPLEHLRSPVRFNVMSMLCIAVLAAYGVQVILQRRKTLLLIAVVPLLLVESSVGAIRLFDGTIPPALRSIASDEETGSVLELPLVISEGSGWLAARRTMYTQFYQPVHGKKTFSGVVSRLGGEEVFMSYFNFPLIRTVLMMQNSFGTGVETYQYVKSLGPGLLKRSKAADMRLAETVANLFDLDYVIFYKGYGDKHVLDFLMSALALRKLSEDDRVIVYRVDRSNLETAWVDAGAESSSPNMYRGWINGFRDGETTYAWSASRESTVLVNLKGGEGRTLQVRMMPRSAARDMSVRVFFNNAFLVELTLEEGWKTFTVTVPGELVNEGLNRVTFRSEDPDGRAEAGGADIPVSKLPGRDSTGLDWDQGGSKLGKGQAFFALDNLYLD